jgi:hypothetical protein
MPAPRQIIADALVDIDMPTAGIQHVGGKQAAQRPADDNRALSPVHWLMFVKAG